MWVKCNNFLSDITNSICVRMDREGFGMLRQMDLSCSIYGLFISTNVITKSNCLPFLGSNLLMNIYSFSCHGMACDI